MTDVVLDLKHITKHYVQSDETLEILKAIDLSIKAGELVALVGPSGSGKSTLLHIAGLLDRPNTGEVAILGEDTATIPDKARTKLRSGKIGFVYQFHHLLPEFTAIENAAMPEMISGVGEKEARTRAKAYLVQFGLQGRLRHRPSQLSGGERQRVAIARALANKPALLLADEPTGNLDNATAGAVLDDLIAIAKEQKLAGLIATHNEALAQRMDRIVELKDGMLL